MYRASLTRFCAIDDHSSELILPIKFHGFRSDNLLCLIKWERDTEISQQFDNFSWWIIAQYLFICAKRQWEFCTYKIKRVFLWIGITTACNFYCNCWMTAQFFERHTYVNNINITIFVWSHAIKSDARFEQSNRYLKNNAIDTASRLSRNKTFNRRGLVTRLTNWRSNFL